MFHDDESIKHQITGESSGRKWTVTIGFFFLGCALIAGIGLPLALELRSSHFLEARLQVVRRILSEAPLIDGYDPIRRIRTQFISPSQYQLWIPSKYLIFPRTLFEKNHLQIDQFEFCYMERSFGAKGMLDIFSSKLSILILDALQKVCQTTYFLFTENFLWCGLSI